MLQHIQTPRCTPRKVTLALKTARIHKVNNFKRGIVKQEITTQAKVRRVFFGACLIPWKGRWHGLGISFIPVVHL